MSFLGKILVVFQLAASLVFMCFAAGVYATHTKWKKSYDTLVQTSNTDRTRLTQERDEKEGELRAAIAAKQKAESDLAEAQKAAKDLADQIEAAKARENQRLVESANNTQLHNIANAEAEARLQEAHLLRDLNKQLMESRTQLALDLGKANDQIKGLQINLDAAAAKNSELLRQAGRMQQALAKHKINVDDVIDSSLTTPPAVDGKVIATSPGRGAGSTEMVTISLGADDKLRKGHTMSVFRDAANSGGSPRYLGKIQIIRTEPDSAVGIVIERAGNGSLQKGDNVTTKL